MINLDNLVGKRHKLVIQESDNEKVYSIFGIIRDIDYDNGLITIESDEGLGCINIRAIKAIRPLG